MPNDSVGGYETRKLVNVPMIMYHSIVDADDGWRFRHLSCPVATFESHLKALQWANYHSIPLKTLYEYMTSGKEIPSRSVVLTFDDGYLDNWVYAYPLLRKYGFEGVVFVNPDFVDPAEVLRPNLQDVWNKQVSADDLPISGFLSWAEMREMERSGVIEIQSHGLTHTWYFSSGELIDFHHPGDPYVWLAWNAHPERKHLWMTEAQQAFVPWGAPVYQHEKSLATRRYFPDQHLGELLVDYVRDHGNETFFGLANWRQKLEEVVKDYRQAHGDYGRFESDEEYQARLRHELAESKRSIEIQLDKRVDFLCWPGGGYNETSLRIAREVGYLASTLSSRDRSRHRNVYGADPSRWRRVSPPTFRWGDTSVEYRGGFHLIFLLDSVRGSRLHTAMYRALRLPFKLSQWFGYQHKHTHV